MPQHKSCEKRMRTSAKERSRNRHYRGMMKKAIRRVREATSRTEGMEAFSSASRLLDRIAGKGIIHKRRAADRKSRLHKFVQSLEG